MAELTNQEIWNAADAVEEIGKKEFNGHSRVQFQLGRLIDRLVKRATRIKKNHRELIQQNGKLNDKNFYEVLPENIKKFEAEVNELMETKQEISWPEKIQWPAAWDVKPGLLAHLGDFIEEAPEQKLAEPAKK